MADNDDIFGSDEAGASTSSKLERSRTTKPRRLIEESQSTHINPSIPLSSQSGSDLARSMSAAEAPYHPIVIVGNSSSGKTHLVVSLLAALNIEGEWGLRSEFCRDLEGSQTKEGERLYNELVQKFIQGKGAAATRGISDVFFVPVKVSSHSDGERRFAFMESAGEWYTPDRDSAEYFQPLRESIKTFLTDFEKPITFVYVLPYTQINTIGGARNASDDVQQREIAGLSIVGVIDQYHIYRGPNRFRDNHLLLVSKWDVHQMTTDSAASLDEILLDCPDDVEPFLEKNYLQALTKFKTLASTSNQVRVFHYSAGRMDGQRIVPMDRGSETSRAIGDLQARIWGWIWGNASEAQFGSRTTPFPDEVPSILAKLDSLFSKVYRHLDKWL